MTYFGVSCWSLLDFFFLFNGWFVKVGQILVRFLVEILDFGNFILIEHVFVANLLQEPTAQHKLTTDLLQQQRLLGFRTALCNFLVEIRVDVGVLKGLPNDICRARLSGIDQPSVLDSFLPQTELEHLDSLDEVLVDVLLPFEHALQLSNSLLELGLLKEPFGLFCVVGALQVLQRGDDLVKWDRLFGDLVLAQSA
jgi:hypothetical protein